MKRSSAHFIYSVVSCFSEPGANVLDFASMQKTVVVVQWDNVLRFVMINLDVILFPCLTECLNFVNALILVVYLISCRVIFKARS